MSHDKQVFFVIFMARHEFSGAWKNTLLATMTEQHTQMLQFPSLSWTTCEVLQHQLTLFQELFQGAKSIVMLIFLLFSDKVFRGEQKCLRGEHFKGPVEESQHVRSFLASLVQYIMKPLCHGYLCPVTF